jgi:urea transport system permease protein
MRAVMQNRQLAACSGVATDRVDQRTFFIGSGLAGVAGVALTLIGPIGPTLGTNYIVDAFLVMVVRRLGQLRGAVLAAVARPRRAAAWLLQVQAHCREYLGYAGRRVLVSRR